MAFPRKTRVLTTAGLMVALTGIAVAFVGLVSTTIFPEMATSLGFVTAGIGFVAVGIGFRFAPIGSAPRMMGWHELLMGSGVISGGLGRACFTWIDLHGPAINHFATVKGLALDFMGAGIVLFLLALVVLIVEAVVFATSPKLGRTGT